MLSIASTRQQITRDFISLALSELDHGFSAFDSALISGCAKISSRYDVFYAAWAKAVQGNEVAERLKKDPRVSPELLNHYTIIQLDAQQNYFHTTYASYFASEISSLVEAFDELVESLRAVQGKTKEQELYVDYFLLYRDCLAEKDIEKVDSLWHKLDQVWMDIKYHIQVVHDMEYGYGDVLRVKVIPDFSLRFVDESFAAANKTIDGEIKSVMVDYFGKRNAELAKKGLFALANSFAAIYYVPFQCGMSNHFRFTGQSIPNRSEVKDEKGVKIYFDPVASTNRIETVKKLVNKVVQDTSLAAHLSPVDDLVYHVAAHEFGHAIYGLGHVASVTSAPTRSLLEEPRAELTSLVTMKLLYENKKISLDELKKYFVAFAIGGLRRFANFDSSSTRPYTVSAIDTYKTYERTSFVKLVNEKIVFNTDKALETLDIFTKQFEEILDAEDALDGSKLQKVMDEMQQETDLTRWLVAQLNTK